ncbi:NUDIX hydrolase [Methylopila jiangsuensis]|uniref:NUDIX hydrolase n=1 Tax=Methylopila jiangsuensis TaxID=586230 RepID=A0A9W6N208_9HYPH|nr:NUDIX hydrolase [Methylopila jiangsuensis]MDR6285685.1 8-oxo-dGTP pyrophosphatase MutT (NUDIX family) [Methylopila jiangsuensis]GLK75444.1 NUDIX hydrolase [Methylopila jiangsuensis]
MSAGEEQGVVPPAAPKAPERLTPKDAATIILVDREAAEPKVLMGKRHEAVRFMPGKYVFPGGRVEADDGRVNIAGAYSPHVERRLQAQVRRPSISRARAYGLAALRELAEETGLLIGERETGAFIARNDAWAPFAEADVFPSLEGLHFVARAITPPGRPKRFDTRFFAADAALVAHRIDGVVTPDAELVDLVWVSFTEAAELDLPPITRMILNDLQRRIDDGLERDLAVPYYRKGSQGPADLI